MPSTAETTAKTALITGAGSGIGRAAAAALNRDGFSLVLTGRNAGRLEETANGLDADGGQRTLTHAADVSKPDDVERLFEAARSEFGRLDVLFNNAGTGTSPVPLDDLPVEEWDQCVGTNLTGVFLCCRQAMRIMKRQDPRGGRIINNGSVSAYAPRPNSAAYTATKHAISGLTKSISLDGRKHDIACSQIDIGNADTDMTKKSRTGLPQASGEIRPEPVFDVDRVGDAISYIAGLPLDVNIQFMTIMATKMPFIGRG